MRKRRSPEEISELVADYRNSGLTQQRYCEQHKVNKSTLGRYLRRDGGGGSQCLVRVRIDPEGKVESDTGFGAGFALVLANGRRIESGWTFADSGLARLIRLVEGV
jgi:hypothetical protein